MKRLLMVGAMLMTFGHVVDAAIYVVDPGVKDRHRSITRELITVMVTPSDPVVDVLFDFDKWVETQGFGSNGDGADNTFGGFDVTEQWLLDELGQRVTDLDAPSEDEAGPLAFGMHFRIETRHGFEKVIFSPGIDGYIRRATPEPSSLLVWGTFMGPCLMRRRRR